MNILRNLLLIILFTSFTYNVEAQLFKVTSGKDHPYKHKPTDLRTTGSAATDGQCLTYDSATAQFEWGTCGSGGSGSGDGGWTTISSGVKLSTTTDNVVIGGSTLGGKLFIDGDTNERQLQVQGHSTQTADILRVEKSTGEIILTVQETGVTSFIDLIAPEQISLTELSDVNSATQGAGRILVSDGANFNSSSLLLVDYTRNVVSTTGNVGINTTIPTDKLSVAGTLSGSTSRLGIVNTEGGKTIIQSGISGQANNGTSFVTADSNGATEVVRMVISAVGNVGINDTSPDASLEVVNDGTGDSFIIADTNDGDTTPFVIVSGGNTGIGDSLPSQKLEVNGNVNLVSPTDRYMIGGVAISLTGLSDVNSSTQGNGRLLVSDGTKFQSVDLLTVDNSAKAVGIGDTTPGADLEINDTTPSNKAFDVQINTGHADGLTTRFSIENNLNDDLIDMNIRSAILNIGSHDEVASNAGTKLTLTSPIGDSSNPFIIMQQGEQLTGGNIAWIFDRSGGFNSYAPTTASTWANWIDNGDTQPYMRLSNTNFGMFEWGPGGSTAPDTNIYRSAANTLKTDDSLVVGGSSINLTSGAARYQIAGAALSLTGLSDVNSNTQGAGRILISDGSKFNSALVGGDMTTTASGSFQLGTDSVDTNELVATAVSAGSCTNCNLTIDADGRVTSQGTGAGGAGAASLTGLSDVNSATQGIGRILISNGTKFNSALVGGDVTADVFGNITIAANAVTAAKIITDGVSADELNATGVEAELEAVLDLNELQGQITDTQIADGAVDGGTGGEIADDSITAADIAAGAVTTSEILDDTVTAADIAGVNSLTATSGRILVADGNGFNSIAMSGDTTITLSGAVAIGADKITEAMLKAVDAAADEEYLTYETTTGDFEWQAAAGGASALIDLSDVNSSTQGAGRILVSDGSQFNSTSVSGCTLTSAGALSCSGGTATFERTFEPQSAKLPATNFMEIDGGNLRWRGLYDDATDECAQWESVLSPYNAGALQASIYYSVVTGTSSKVAAFDVYVMCVTDGDALDVDTDSFGTLDNITSGSISLTAGHLDVITDSSLNGDSCAADDLIIIKVCRDSDGNDTVGGDIELRKIEIYE